MTEVQKFKEKVDMRLESYNGSEIVSGWQKHAYQMGMNHFAEEIKSRLEKEAKTADIDTRAGLLKSIAILEEYGS